MRRRSVLLLAAAVIAAGGPSWGAAPAEPSPPPMIAFMSMAGVNPLHIDFRAPRNARPPIGLPRTVRVPLPTQGSFDDRLAALREGPVGGLRPGVLYHLEGTRLIFLAAGDRAGTAVGQPPSTVSANPREPGSSYPELAHDTGVLGAALSARTGTAPRAWGVVVVGGDDETYGWASGQPWIDVTTRSGTYVAEDGCYGVREVRDVHASGRIVLAAIGNTESAVIAASAPGLASEVFHVGGVDADGRPWTPRVSMNDPLLNLVMPARPYETGDLFTFRTSDFASLNGEQEFGGTSGATPRTAGRAALLIDRARRLLGDRDGGAEPAGRPGRVRRGPLADGKFSRDDLETLLRSTATPALPASPARHAAEGYGALDDRSMRLAAAVLAGQADMPNRADEDAAQARVDTARDAALAARGC